MILLPATDGVTDEYLELLAKESARMRARAEASASGVADSSVDEDGFEDDDDDDDDDETVFVSRELARVAHSSCLLTVISPSDQP